MKETSTMFDKILQQIGNDPSWDKYLKDAVVTKVKVNPRKKTWVVHISVPEMMPFNVWQSFQQKLSPSLLPRVKAIYAQFYYKNLDLEVALTTYKHWIQTQVEDRFGTSAGAWLGKARWEVFYERIQIAFSNPAVAEIARRKKLEDAVAKYWYYVTGTEVLVQFVVKKIDSACESDKENLELKEAQNRREQQLIQEALENASAGQRVEENDRKDDRNAEVHRDPKPRDVRPLSTLDREEKRVVVAGKIFKTDRRVLRSGRQLLTFHLTDGSHAIACKYFFRNKPQDEPFNKVKRSDWVKVRGSVQFDSFSKELALMPQEIGWIESQDRQDKEDEKRIEFHLHTAMSTMDGVYDAKEVVAHAAKWGHSAIAITDHGVAQAFPDAYDAGKKHDIKILFGMEANIVDDNTPIVFRSSGDPLDEAIYVVFDVETTGLSVVHDQIIEIAAVKMQNGKILGRFESFVNPHKRLSAKTVELTGITDDMVVDAPEIHDVIGKFVTFMGDACLVAHNADFDMGFLQEAVKLAGLSEVTNCVLDTLQFARSFHPGLKNYRLNTLCARFSIHLEQHHRAIYDAQATGELLFKLLRDATDQGVKNLHELSRYENKDFIRIRPYHVVLLVQNQVGLKNLYKLISLSHLQYYYRIPRIPRSVLEQHREGLLIGSGCEKGEFFEAVLNKSFDEAKRRGMFYDYLEIEPLDVNQHLIDKGVIDNKERLITANQLVIQLGEELSKPVVATGNVHYLHPEDRVYRQVLAMNQSGGFRDTSPPPAHFRTTREMLDEFNYLGENKSREVVIENPHKLAAEIENIKPFPDGTFTPIMEGADDEIYSLSYQTAHEWYGDELPELVQQRLDKELDAIIKHGFSNLYLISQKIVAKSLDDGYLVGSRGSVGSSFIATLTRITEVNPLPPHYRCSFCRKSEFFTDGSFESGFDLPDKRCEMCDELMVKDGHDIAFETFLGFEGNKTPDIDLNFASEYQPRAHSYTEELFGKDYIFRAGTIGTIKEKTAFGFVKKYEEEKGLTLKNAEIEQLVQGCAGVKRTTGQHPGGLMVVPQDMEIYDFTPIQRPADDMKSDIITTHFDYRSISGRILKLDILGHTAPSILKMLEDFTGIDPTKVPCDDPKVMSIFSGTKALGVSPEDINDISIGTLGIPEFGTVFARGILEDTRPTTVSELTRISGLSHGTDVWAGNAQDLIKRGSCTLSNAICNRDDIMSYLIHQGLPPKSAFTIMEKVRKGKKLEDNEVSLMEEHSVPKWYIDSCLKIKYLFPRAHAAAYVIMAVRIAYFKVYYPREFYAALFTKSVHHFDISEMLKGHGSVRKLVQDITEKGFGASQKEKGLLTILELVQEMYARGISFHPVHLYRSDATRFLIKDKDLLPPFASINGVGENLACSIMEAREEEEFLSVDDFQKRTKASSTVVEILKEMGCLRGLSQSNQLSLFG